MASNNKRKTTMAKLNRERGLAERRLEKQARRAARKQAASDQQESSGASSSQEEAQPLANRPAVDAATEAFGRMAESDAREQKPK
jgi:DNA segregation ATPase FtsK/SpoIIIE-like protein